MKVDALLVLLVLSIATELQVVQASDQLNMLY
jgi:hypothetical protein